MTLHRRIDGADRPGGRLAGTEEVRRSIRSTRLASGTLACPRCDAPVALATRTAAPADPLGCPYCAHTGAVRDFLSLQAPTRPARVVVRVVA